MDTLKKYWTKITVQRKIVNKKKEEADGTAVENFQNIINFLNKCAWYSGIKYVNDWKLTLVSTWDAWASAFFFALFMWYTIIFVHSTDNIALIGGLAFNFTVWNKMIIVIRSHKKFMSLLDFVFKLLESNNDHPEREGILRGVSKTVKWHVNFNVVGVCAGIAVFSVVPTYDCLVHRKLTPVSSMVTPFTKDGSILSYLINSFFNVLFCLYGLSFGVSVSSMFFLFVDVYNGMALILKHALTQFDNMYISNDKSQDYDKPFRNIMLMLQDLARYNNYMNELYSIISAVQITCSYIVIVSCVGGFLAFDYVGGIGAGVALYTELLIYCYIGQLQNDTNKLIVQVIFDSAWYTYDLRFQKGMMLALQLAQKFKSTDLAGLFPLNFETGLAITRSIFTLIMFMERVL